MENRLTEKTIGVFEYDLANFQHKPKEFNDYDAFYAYSMAVKRLGEFESIGTPSHFAELVKAEQDGRIAECTCGECRNSTDDAFGRLCCMTHFNHRTELIPHESTDSCSYGERREG